MGQGGLTHAMRRLARLAVLLALLGTGTAAWAGTDAAHWWNGRYIFRIGLSQDQAQLTVKGVNGGASSIGKLQSSLSALPTVGISTPSTYFDDSSHWGYYYFADFSYAKVDRQTQTSPGLTPASFSPIYGRQVDGGAALFLSFGDKMVDDLVHGKQFRIGVGVGLSYAEMYGTVPGQYMDNGQPHSINAGGWGTSANLIMRGTWNAWYLELNIYSANLTRQYEQYSISDASLTLGYSVPFRL